MSQLNVLIVEDEMIVAMEIRNYLQHLGCHIVDMVKCGEEAMNVIGHNWVDMVIMDIYLEGEIDGIESALQIKEEYPFIEVVFLSANRDDRNLDRVANLSPLAYLSKPFNRQELYVIINMFKAKERKTDLLYLDETFAYSLEYKMLYKTEKLVKLTKKERELLALLIKHKEHIVSYETIEFTLWSDKVVTANTLRSLVRRLRKKLKYQFIKTHANEGYRLTLN